MHTKKYIVSVILLLFLFHFHYVYAADQVQTEMRVSLNGKIIKSKQVKIIKLGDVIKIKIEILVGNEWKDVTSDKHTYINNLNTWKIELINTGEFRARLLEKHKNAIDINNSAILQIFYGMDIDAGKEIDYFATNNLYLEIVQ